MLLCCVLGISIGILLRHCCSANVRVFFAETDAKASEDKLFIQATVLVKGAKDLQRKHNFILTVIPLTVGEYLQLPGRYGNSCDSIIMTSNVDPAEGKFLSRLCSLQSCQIHIYFSIGLFHFISIPPVLRSDLWNLHLKNQLSHITPSGIISKGKLSLRNNHLCVHMHPQMFWHI